MSDVLMLEVPGPADSERLVRISSPTKIVFPEDDITKADLARYMLAVSSEFLRWSGGRPVALERYPKGINERPFFSKNPPKGLPPYGNTVLCTYPSGRQHAQLVLDEPAMLAWCVQMNTLTFHPWPVQISDVDRPDEIRLDLDPQPGRSFADVVEAARALKEVMTGLGLTPFVKTSGNRGLHVYARITPNHEFLDVRHGVIAIARMLERAMPDLVTTQWWKELRGDKIFVDFNQAARDRTIAAPYSPRPLPGAPVSMPVAWAALSDLHPRDFTVKTVPDILLSQGDAWAPPDGAAMTDCVGTLGAALDLWDEDVEKGLPEMPFPPDYPKMPGEPPRVQPSRARRNE